MGCDRLGYFYHLDLAVPVVFGFFGLYFALLGVKRIFSARPSVALESISKGFAVGSAAFSGAKLIRSIGIYLEQEL